MISQPDYEPSDMDILYAEGITSTNGLSCMEYSFPESTQNSSIDSSNQNDPLVRLLSNPCFKVTFYKLKVLCTMPDFAIAVVSTSVRFRFSDGSLT